MVDDDLERLKAVVCAYGAQPERWPPDERERLKACAAAHGDAQWMENERKLDDLLATVPGARMGEGLASAIVAAARNEPRAVPDRVTILVPPPARQRPSIGLGNAGPAALLAASLIGGMWVGSYSSVDALINGEQFGLAELAPGETDDPSFTTLWETISGEEVSL